MEWLIWGWMEWSYSPLESVGRYWLPVHIWLPILLYCKFGCPGTQPSLASQPIFNQTTILWSLNQSSTKPTILTTQPIFNQSAILWSLNQSSTNQPSCGHLTNLQPTSHPVVTQPIFNQPAILYRDVHSRTFKFLYNYDKVGTIILYYKVLLYHTVPTWYYSNILYLCGIVLR